MSNGKDKIVARMVKFHSNDVTGIRRHNERELSDASLAKSPSWIRPEDSHLNYDLVDGIKMTSKVVDKRLEELRDSRGGKRKLGKNGVRVCEWLISNNYGYMSSLDEAEQRRYFESNLQFFKDRYGDECIAYAKVHMDESTPHMHLGILPVTEDGRVNANDIFTRATLREIQTELAEHLQNDGFDVSRGEMDSKRKHLSTIEYKAKKVSEGWAEHQQIMAELEADRLGFDEAVEEKMDKINDVQEKLNTAVIAYSNDKAKLDKERAEFEREKDLWESQKAVRESELREIERQESHVRAELSVLKRSKEEKEKEVARLDERLKMDVEAQKRKGYEDGVNLAIARDNKESMRMMGKFLADHMGDDAVVSTIGKALKGEVMVKTVGHRVVPDYKPLYVGFAKTVKKSFDEFNLGNGRAVHRVKTHNVNEGEMER